MEPGAQVADEQVERTRAALKAMPFLPALFGVIAFLAPDFSLPLGVLVAVLVAASVLLTVFLLGSGRYRSFVWAAVAVIFDFDLFAFFGGLIAWRALGGRAWAAILVFGLLVTAAAVGYVFREAILQELVAPRTRLGLVLAGVAGVGGGGAGALAFAAGRDAPGPAIGVAILFAMVYVLVAVHALWLRVQHPEWQPVAARRPRRRPAARLR